ncbi:VacJ family lipoprotein [Desulfovibrio sp. OttesenSCG-928-C14]|nr:VacJ family lipoprotein [Desulfovibrio sp. OttesenSCG-928-C14]
MRKASPQIIAPLLILCLLLASLPLAGCSGGGSPESGYEAAARLKGPLRAELVTAATDDQAALAEDEAYAMAQSSLDDDDYYLDATEAIQVISDPLEPWNRVWYHFNDVTIEYLIRPLYTGYTYVTPDIMRQGISNFFRNLGAPVRIVNNLLQGKGMEAGVEFSSFIMNTGFGLGGLIDLASGQKKVVEPTPEDGGQTLGVWGLGEGIYLVWPLLGPSNVRDTLGMGIDYAANPLTYLIDDWEVSLGIKAFEAFNDMDKTLDAYDTMKGMAVEPYTALRDGYTQFRRAQIEK